MLFTAALVATHAVAATAGAVAWPHISALYTAYKSSKAYKDAVALVQAAEAQAKALQNAKALIAAKVAAAPAAAGPTGAATGATGGSTAASA